MLFGLVVVVGMLRPVARDGMVTSFVIAVDPPTRQCVWCIWMLCQQMTFRVSSLAVCRLSGVGTRDAGGLGGKPYVSLTDFCFLCVPGGVEWHH